MNICFRTGGVAATPTTATGDPDRPNRSAGASLIGLENLNATAHLATAGEREESDEAIHFYTPQIRTRSKPGFPGNGSSFRLPG